MSNFKFSQLRTKGKNGKVIDPIEIFRRLPKPPGINDLYSSQAAVLAAWFERRKDRDVVVKLHTGGGKTLVGLLMAQSTLNETGDPVLYLAPTIQLVGQAIEKATGSGIRAVPYEKGQKLHADFLNGKAVMVATYQAFFNGNTKFGVRHSSEPVHLGAVIVDDAHAAFAAVRDQFTIEVDSKDKRSLYETLAGLFRSAFKQLDRLGTFDAVVRGSEYHVLEVPYWAWRQKLDGVQRLLEDAFDDSLEWRLLRDKLKFCQALVNKNGFTVTPVLPLIDMFPAFSEAPRRIYMSATLADDSEIIRTFAADPALVKDPLSSPSLAGVSERMILVPQLMRFKADIPRTLKKLAAGTAAKKLGVVVLVPSEYATTAWADTATVPSNSAKVGSLVDKLQQGDSFGPVVLAGRYDGIDLPGDSCRLLIMDGLPRGTGNYEMFRASALYGGATLARTLAQRLEQGIGRGARGSGDYCVVILAGKDLAAWIAKDANFRFLTPATRAQLEIGIDLSKTIKKPEDLLTVIQSSFDRDPEWTEVHAETLAEKVDAAKAEAPRLEQAAAERKAFDLWVDNYPEKAIAAIEKVADSNAVDAQTRGWMQQAAARIADSWGNSDRAEDLQQSAYANNRNLTRPLAKPPYRPMDVPGEQSQRLVEQIGQYRQRLGFLALFEEAVTYLNANASPNQFEQALTDLGNMIGLSAERFDSHGEGPDVLWLLPDKMGLVIEAKSRKQGKNALTKSQHGQLLVAGEWFKMKYDGYARILVSVHPSNNATKAAVAGASHALTYTNLAMLVDDARTLLTTLCESQLSGADLLREAGRALSKSSIRAERLFTTFLVPFTEVESEAKGAEESE